MKNLFLIFFVIAAFRYTAHSQSNIFEYSYDQNGNRIIRELILEEIPEEDFAESEASFTFKKRITEEKEDQKSDSTLADTSIVFNKDFIVSVYPNPTFGLVNIESSSDGLVTVINSQGASVKKLNITKGITKIDLNQLDPGTYYIVANSNVSNLYWKVVKIN